jgi:peptidoglycan/xylan/chitin deacetylase (PgdA/CDA1 family)/glycosyltransferase involved in cell wall biosynthesis
VTILHLLSQLELTGAEVYVQTLVQAQLDAGHKVLLVSDRLHVDIPAPWISLPVSSSDRSVRRQVVIGVKDLIHRHQVDIVHCHSRAAARIADRAVKEMKPAQVTTLHGRQHYSLGKRLKNRYGQYQIAICENVSLACQQEFKMSPWAIRVIRNPLNFAYLDFDDRERRLKKIAVIGRSSGPKGERIGELVVQALPEWLKHPDISVDLICGDLENYSAAAQEAYRDLEKKYGERVRWHGHLQGLTRLMKNYDLVVGSGRVAMEAIACGVPVWALGEYGSIGFVTKDSWLQALSSNFGDIGVEAMTGPWSASKVSASILDFIGREVMSSQERKDLRQWLEADFSVQSIHQKIMDVYRSALFKKNHPKPIPILMYHKIPDQDLQSVHKIYVNKMNFEKHLKFFRRRGFETLTFSELAEFWDGRKSFQQFPRKALILTFDDGYQDNLANAEPLLKKYGMKATIFLLADHDITENTWDSNTREPSSMIMTLAEKKQLDPAVWEVGSHGFHHLHLTQVPEEKAFEEMKDSKERLEKDLNRQVVAFAYPFGSSSLRLAELCQKAGYKFAVNTDQGGIHTADNPFFLFRVNIFPLDGAWALLKKTSSWYRLYFYKKRKR